MKGLELSERYFEEYGLPMLSEKFPEYLQKMAVGLVGHGSECFGFDDDVSLDHDFEPRFYVFLTDEDEREIGFKLAREYQKLPDEFMGVKIKKSSRFGDSYKGVTTINGFYSFYLGDSIPPKTNAEWLNIPDFYLAEATNGKVFFDNLGRFTEIRQTLLNDRPMDVKLKKLASALFLTAQSGQYNYARCARHGQEVSAAIALTEFIKNVMDCVFLLNDRYAPYYKWTFKAMEKLGVLTELSEPIKALVTAPLDFRNNQKIIESVCKKIIEHLIEFGYVSDRGDYLEPYAYAVQNLIKDVNLRNDSVV